MADEIALVLDRLTSASTESEVEGAFEALIANKDATSWVQTDAAAWETVLTIARTGQRGHVEMESRTNAVLLVQQVLQEQHSTVLQDAALVETCMDVASNTELSAYPRTVAIATLLSAWNYSRQKVQDQLLQAPHGLHRLAQLLNDTDAAVASAALPLHVQLATSAALAKLLIFEQVPEFLVQNANSLESWNAWYALLQHDAAVYDLVLTPVTTRALAQVLDLRNGTEFQNPTTKKTSAPPLSKKKRDDLDEIMTGQAPTILPHLTSPEEACVSRVLDILELLLQKESLRVGFCVQYPGLASLVWELALVTPPPSDQKPSCAFPSVTLQQQGLHLASLLPDETLWKEHDYLQRLLYLACSGGSLAESLSDKLSIQQAAHYCLRQGLSDQAAQDLVLASLSPDEEGPKVCLKLVSTFMENLQERHKITKQVRIGGALGALALLCRHSASQALLLKLMDVNDLWKAAQDPALSDIVLRFLSQWMQYETTAALFDSVHSSILTELVQSSEVRSRACLVLGLGVVELQQEHGGWTKESILQNIRQMGTSKFLQLLNDTNDEWWKYSALEYRVYQTEQQALIRRVRQAVLQGLMQQQTSDESGDTAEVTLAQQALEVDRLKEALQAAESKLNVQDKELASWKKRMESNPTQLDEMLNDFTTKTATLEQQVQDLKATETKLEQERDEAVQAKATAEASLAEELEDTQAERDAAREEVTGLTAMCANLETQLQQASNVAPVASDQPAGTEVVLLRSENERLKADNKAANEWMQDAYGKMQELDSENITLKEQLAQGPAPESSDQMTAGLAEALESKSVLEARVQQLQIQLHAMQSNETSSVQVQGQEVAELKSTVGSLNLRISDLNSELLSTREEHEREIHQREARIREFETRIREGGAGGASAIELERKDAEIAELKRANEEAQEWMNMAKDHNEMLGEQVSALTAENEKLASESSQTIANLEKQLEAVSGSTSIASSDDSETVAALQRQLDEVNANAVQSIEQWQLANQALEDRASTAEQHLAEAQQTSKDLTSELDAAKSELDSEVSQARIAIEGWQDSYTQVSDELAALKAHMEASPDPTEIEALRAEVTTLREQLAESQSGAQETQASAEATSELDNNLASSSDAEEEVIRLRAEVESVREQLLETETAARSTIEMWQEAHAASVASAEESSRSTEETTELRQEIESLREQLLRTEEEAQQSIAKWQEAHASALAAADEAASTSPSHDANEKANLEEEVATLKKQVEDSNAEAQTTIASWQDAHAAMQVEVTELQSALKEACDNPVSSVVNGELIELREEVAALKQRLDSKETEIQKLLEATASHEPAVDSDEVALLCEQVKALESKLENTENEAQTTIESWQEAHAYAEARIRELESTASGDDTESSLEHDELVRLRDENDRLTKEVEDIESNAQSTIATWHDAHAKSEARVQELEEALKAYSEADALHEEVTLLKKQLEDTESQAQATITSWQEAHAASEAQIRELMSATEGSENTANLIDNDDTIRLRNEVATLQKEIGDANEEAQATISSWQEAHATAEAQVNELQRQTAVQDEEAMQLRSELSDLKQQLEDVETSAETTIASWQEAHAAAEAQTAALSAGTESTEGNVESEDITKLRDEVAVLSQQLEDTREEAQTTIASWQQAHTASEARVVELQAMLESIDVVRSGGAKDAEEEELVVDSDELRTLQDEIESLKRQLEESELKTQALLENDEVVSLREEVELLKRKLDESEMKIQSLSADEPEKPSDEIQKELEEQVEKYAALQSSHDELIKQLEITETDADDCIKQWQEAHQSAQTELDQLRDSLGVETPQREIYRLVRRLSEEQETSKSTVQQWKASFESKKSECDSEKARADDLANEVDTLKTQILSLTTQLESSVEDTGHGSTSSAEGLEKQVEALQKELEDKEEQQALVNAKVSELEDANSALQADVRDLSASIEDDKKDAEEKERSLLSLKDELSVAQTSMKDLQQQVQQLTEDMENQAMEANDSIEAWKADNDSLSRALEAAREDAANLSEADRQQLQEQVDTTRELLTKSEVELSETRSRLAAMKEDMENLNDERVKLEAELDLTVVDKDRCERQIEEMEKELAGFKTEADEIRASSSDLDDKVARLEAEKNDLSRQLQEQGQELQVVKDISETLTVENGQLEDELNEASEVIGTWQQSFEELEQRLLAQVKTKRSLVATALSCIGVQHDFSKSQDVDEVTRSLVDEDIKLEASINDLVNRFHEAESNLVSSRNANEDANEVISSLRHALESKELELNDSSQSVERQVHQQHVQNRRDQETIAHLETERHELLSQKAALEQSNSNLQRKVDELEDELIEMSDTVQHDLTDEIVRKATEVASDALRQQVDDLHRQAEIDRSACLTERQARRTAEAEVKRLRQDLASLVGASDATDSGEFQRMTMSAQAVVHRKQRIEIESLMKSITYSMEELAKSKSREKDAEERAAKSSLQAAMLEQELSGAKHDFKTLTETMDDMREAENVRREALEYRIQALENDQLNLQKLHGGEIDTLRNEVSHLTMERDRLFQNLRDSEKSRESLVASQSTGDDSNDLDRLRLENAQLVSASAEDAARLERKLHEAMEANRSSSEADLILEQELRRSVETMAEGLNQEVADLRQECTRLRATLAGTEAVYDNHDQVVALQQQVQQLTHARSTLEERLEKLKQEAESKVARAVEDSRIAKARALQLERENRYQHEVRLEVERLGHGDDDHSPDPAEETAVPEKSTSRVAELYDVIQQQNVNLHEEREMYNSLREEHDDLLALLAQNDLTLKSAHAALERWGGPEAVALAQQQAEEQAVEQYGKFVREE